MNDNRAVVADADHELEALAAELTSAAYAVALRHGVEDKWLDLELELWEALKETVKKCGQEPPHFSDVAFVCDWAPGQSEGVRPVRDGLGHGCEAR